MKHFFSSRISRSLGLLLLLSAAIHLVLLAVHSVATFNLKAFNLFDILDLDLFFPDIAKGTASFTLSAVITFGILLVIFLRMPKSARRG